ncbi:MAG: serine kinase [Rhodobacter sp.]|nr:serine kinase [Cupriavidus sp.]MCA3512051.1 serine kinase [Rhodobacter sp.]MCA3519810.1 serine kinase [Rhodobacter sp.]MCA3523552.1 serine kinase [Rhodobacter sp.]MCA3526926.1 serine kinase [Rhodobacter sp.]
MKGPRSFRLHASCVALEGRGLLILGPSGSGKSSLALQMIGLGAALVADDQVDVTCAGDALVAAAPPALAGLIEARGVGLLRAGTVACVPLHLAVDLGQPASPRLPDQDAIVLLERRIALVKGPLSTHLPAALLLYLRGGRHA